MTADTISCLLFVRYRIQYVMLIHDRPKQIPCNVKLLGNKSILILINTAVSASRIDLLINLCKYLLPRVKNVTKTAAWCPWLSTSTPLYSQSESNSKIFTGTAVDVCSIREYPGALSDWVIRCTEKRAVFTCFPNSGS